jgi:hypothetical protein
MAYIYFSGPLYASLFITFSLVLFDCRFTRTVSKIITHASQVCNDEAGNAYRILAMKPPKNLAFKQQERGGNITLR